MSSSSPLDPLFLHLQQTLAGRYSLDRELGRGGMGIVYLAREVHLDRLVAIKLLPPERAADPRLRDRFLREARLAAKLSHPNIIPIHSVEEAGDFVFFVMAFIDGETLTQRVRGRGPLSGTEGARVLREVAWALSYAHGQGLVHRDVKPDNILLENVTHRVLVADFGIAAAFGDDATDGVTGTPEFMSPEQVLGKPSDARSDLYSLGATAFFAFTGRYPFEGKSATEVLAKQVTEPAPPLAALGVAVPRKVAGLVERCLAKEPEHRPDNAQALAEQLGVALEKRRELPVALRAFVKRTGRLNGGGTIVFGFLLLPATTLASSYFGAAAGWAAFALGAVAAPLGYLVFAARRLLRLGFGHGDIAPAFHAEIEQSREELTAGLWRGPSALERAMKFALKISGSVAVVSFVAVLGTTFAHMPVAWFRALRFLPSTFFFSFSGSMVLALGTLALMQRHRDVDGEFWAKVWNGRIGRLAFALARRLVGHRPAQTAVTHRATELSLGMAAEELFESLPHETRRALGALPGIVRRLQEDAQALRQRQDDLQDALVSAGEAAGSSPDYADVRSLRDRVQAQLGETVVALETIRLNLLRLHAGSATVESLTTQLGAAAEVSAEVQRLIEARGDVERALRFPRSGAPTPA